MKEKGKRRTAGQAGAASLGEIKILTSNSSLTVLDALASAFERASGHRYAVTVASAKVSMLRFLLAPAHARVFMEKGLEQADAGEA